MITTSGTQALCAAQDYIAHAQPWIFLPDARKTVLVRDGLDGIGRMASPTGTWSPELLTLSGAMACPRETADAHPVGH